MGQGLRIMRILLDQPTPGAKNRRTRAEEERELALLAQFLRHNSVASLAKAIAERNGIKSRDLIVAAGLEPRRAGD
jgi:hypothetical protein